MNLKNRRIVITGGTSGIGKAIVQQLCPDNEVIVIGRNEKALKELSERYQEVITYQADLAKLEEVEQVADEIVTSFESIDLLINNAAVQHTAEFLDEDFRYETIAQEITVNLTSVCGQCYLLLPSLLHDEKAVILNVNSGLALTSKTQSALYCATKGGLDRFSQSLSYQLDKTNIKVLQVFLELVETKMSRGRGKNKLSAKDAAKKILYGIEHEIQENDIGKVKLLRFLLRLVPSIARKILKNS